VNGNRVTNNPLVQRSCYCKYTLTFIWYYSDTSTNQTKNSCLRI